MSDEPPLEGEVIPRFLQQSEYEGENLGGRPRLYDTPEQFDEAVNLYIENCYMRHEPLSITGMSLSLGFCSVKTLYNYANYEGFTESVLRARTMVEYSYEKKPHGPNSAGAKFALACLGQDDRWRTVKEHGADEINTHEDRLAHLR